MNSQPRYSFRKATAVGLTLIVLLLIVNMLVSQWNTRRVIENGHKVAHTQRVLTTLEEVLARVTEAETSERGFLITGDAKYLTTYQNAIDRTGETLERLRSLTVDDPTQAGRIRALQARVQARFDELREAIAAQHSGGFDAARYSVSTNHGRELMGEMLELVGTMQADEEAALAKRSDESQRSARVTMITDLLGSLLGIGMVGVATLLFRRELAQRQRAQDAGQRLAAIVESSDDAIVSKTLDGLIMSWNAGARRIYGYRADEVIGRPIALLCPRERIDEIQFNLDRVRRGEHIEHFETIRIRKDGQRIDVSLRISPLKDSSGTVIGASAIARDITERKLLQREVLEIAAREQQRIGQDLHDGTGQELTGLAMVAERLTGDLEHQDSPQAATAARIVDGLEEALNHVRSLSKGLVPVELDAEGLMAALADLAERTSQLPDVACTLECDEPVRILDNQTATHLYRLSQEAVTNALKHGRARRITLKLTSDPEFITLQITDDGRGFDNERDAAGTGLRIMAYRAELIRGNLTIGRVRPHGTSITCKLPRQLEPCTVGFEDLDRPLPAAQLPSARLPF
ncbi:MAG: CHASE3 domain-containing protein [Pirellulales bacterium]|nr:CHASE3 domain-containing protein [Pirellulales bacterium]